MNKKILICGDSWTEGYGLDYKLAWPFYLIHDVVNVAKSGSTNQQILEQFKENYSIDIDLVIIVWSGCTRHCVKNEVYEFSTIHKQSASFFKTKSLQNLLQVWESYIDEILKISTVPVLQYSVFGDQPTKEYPNFNKKSFLEYLANDQGVFFKYQIPIFEFGWLSKNNYDNFTKDFGKKYFPKKWKKACIERETIRDSKNFLICGHPSEEGHKVWASFIKNEVDKFL